MPRGQTITRCPSYELVRARLPPAVDTRRATLASYPLYNHYASHPKRQTIVTPLHIHLGDASDVQAKQKPPTSSSALESRISSPWVRYKRWERRHDAGPGTGGTRTSPSPYYQRVTMASTCSRSRYIQCRSKDAPLEPPSWGSSLAHTPAALSAPCLGHLGIGDVKLAHKSCQVASHVGPRRPYRGRSTWLGTWTSNATVRGCAVPPLVSSTAWHLRTKLARPSWYAAVTSTRTPVVGWPRQPVAVAA